MREYRNVVVDEHGTIIGQYTQEPATATSHWINFRANRELLLISEGIDRHPDLYDVVWLLQDGYGEKGYTPPQGWDWSGIRDSTPAALREMYELVSIVFDDAALDAVLGI